jgi:hypothetical protein
LSLDTWDVAERLYLARGSEVPAQRPLFTGDVIDGVAIPAVQEQGTAMIVAHPCAMRSGPALAEQVLVAAVLPHDNVPPHKWTDGYYDRMPLPELRGDGAGFEVARLGHIGLAAASSLTAGKRIAILAPVGLNILQQRNVFNLTRVEVPTAVFWDAFANTYEEADLLQEWIEELETRGAHDVLIVQFEAWIRQEARQDRLRDPQQRASVRAEMRKEIRARV